VVGEATYGYKPLVCDDCMKRAAGGATSGDGVDTLTETLDLKDAGGQKRDARGACPGGGAAALGAIAGTAGQARTIPGCICPKRAFPPMLADPP